MTRPDATTKHRNGTSEKRVLTDAVVAEVTAWQAPPLKPLYPVVFFDGLRVKIRDESVARSKAVSLALAVLPDGMRDILIAVTDGLKGMSEALAVAFPATTRQTCLVHLIRNSLDFAGWQDRKALAKALRLIYTAASAETAAAELGAFAAGAWGRRFPTVVKMWRQAWEHVLPSFAFPPALRRVIYTTNALESVHARVRKVIKAAKIKTASHTEFRTVPRGRSALFPPRPPR